MLCQWVLYNTTSACGKGRSRFTHGTHCPLHAPAKVFKYCHFYNIGARHNQRFGYPIVVPHFEPPVQGISNLFLPSSCEWWSTSDKSHHMANQQEGTRHLSCQSLTDQVISGNFRKSQLFPPAPGTVNRTPNPTENNLINKAFIIYRERMVLSELHHHTDLLMSMGKEFQQTHPQNRNAGARGRAV